MQVNSDQWYVKWFLWNCKILDKWLHTSYSDQRVHKAMGRGTDLCTFFRTILLGSLVVLLNLVVWVWMICVLLVMPFWLFNVATVAMAVGFVLCLVTALTAIALLILAVEFMPTALQWVTRKASNSIAKAPRHAPTFLQVFGGYLVGVKQRFCPMITIKDSNND